MIWFLSAINTGLVMNKLRYGWIIEIWLSRDDAPQIDLGIETSCGLLQKSPGCKGPWGCWSEVREGGGVSGRFFWHHFVSDFWTTYLGSPWCSGWSWVVWIISWCPPHIACWSNKSISWAGPRMFLVWEVSEDNSLHERELSLIWVCLKSGNGYWPHCWSSLYS